MLTLFRIGLFGLLKDEGTGGKSPPFPQNLLHISYGDETWHS